MLQLAKDLQIFHLTRHAKERKDRSSTSLSPPFELFLRQHRSSAVPRRLSLFFCRYGIAMTSNMVAVPRQQTCQLGSSMLLFFFLSHPTCGRCWCTKNCRSVLALLSHRRWRQPSKYLYFVVVFLVFASVLEVLQSISCLPRAPQISLASRENFCASFFFGSTTIAHLRIRS